MMGVGVSLPFLLVIWFMGECPLSCRSQSGAGVTGMTKSKRATTSSASRIRSASRSEAGGEEDGNREIRVPVASPLHANTEQNTEGEEEMLRVSELPTRTDPRIDPMADGYTGSFLLLNLICFIGSMRSLMKQKAEIIDQHQLRVSSGPSSGITFRSPIADEFANALNHASRGFVDTAKAGISNGLSSLNSYSGSRSVPEDLRSLRKDRPSPEVSKERPTCKHLLPSGALFRGGWSPEHGRSPRSPRTAILEEIVVPPDPPLGG